MIGALTWDYVAKLTLGFILGQALWHAPTIQAQRIMAQRIGARVYRLPWVKFFATLGVAYGVVTLGLAWLGVADFVLYAVVVATLAIVTIGADMAYHPNCGFYFANLQLTTDHLSTITKTLLQANYHYIMIKASKVTRERAPTPPLP